MYGISKHVDNLNEMIAQNVCPLLDTESLKTLVHTFVTLCLDYILALAPKTITDELQHI